MIEGRVTGKRGRQVDLKQPRIQLIIDHYIKAEHLETIVSIRHMHLIGIVQDWLARDDCLYNYVLDSAKKSFIIDLMLS